jgi:hypothetical protein
MVRFRRDSPAYPQYPYLYPYYGGDFDVDHGFHGGFGGGGGRR